MRPIFRAFQGSVALAFVLSVTAVASADVPAARVLGSPADPEVRPDPANEAWFRPVALTVNPLSWILMKFGMNAELLPAPHHGVVLSAFYQRYEVNPALGLTAEGYAAEAGYHYYLGKHGADGIYLGPSLVAAHESLRTPALSSSALGGATGLGGAFDVGGQYVDKSGFTIGAGGGLMYVAALGSLDAVRGEEPPVADEPRRGAPRVHRRLLVLKNQGQSSSIESGFFSGSGQPLVFGSAFALPYSSGQALSSSGTASPSRSCFGITSGQPWVRGSSCDLPGSVGQASSSSGTPSLSVSFGGQPFVLSSWVRTPRTFGQASSLSRTPSPSASSATGSGSSGAATGSRFGGAALPKETPTPPQRMWASASELFSEPGSSTWV